MTAAVRPWTGAEIDALRQVVADPLTAADVAALAGISASAVRGWATRRGIAGVWARRPHPHWVYPGADVRRAIGAARSTPVAVARWAALRRLHRMTVRARVGVL